jgi:uncharacterized protein (DUF1330 family)
MIAKYGGRYLTKGGSHKLPKGGHWKPERIVQLAEYQPLIALRKACTSDLDMLFTLEGA